MPTYEYECDACHHAFEQFQRMTDPAVRKCPKCRKLKVRRLISGGAGVIFKGSGFYETDYKRSRGAGKPGAAGSAEGAKAAGEGGSERGEPKSRESKGESSSSSSDAKSSGGDAKKPSSSETTSGRSESKPAPKSDAPKKKDA